MLLNSLFPVWESVSCLEILRLVKSTSEDSKRLLVVGLKIYLSTALVP